MSLNGKDILKDVKVHHRDILWYLAVSVFMLLDWWLMKHELEIEYSSMTGTLLKATGDVALILLPYWFLPPKWRWTAILPLCIAAVWGISNLAYYRFWSDLIPPAFITMGGNVNGDLMEYGLSLISRNSLLLLAGPCMAVVFLIFMKPSASPAYTGKGKVWLTVLSLLAGMVGQTSYFKTTYSWRCAISPRSIREGLYDHFIGGYTGQKQLYTYNGMTYYSLRFLTDMAGVLSSSVELSGEEQNEIAAFLRNYERNGAGKSGDAATQGATGIDTDSLNVVYIIVESLNSDIVGRQVGGRPVMPVLDSLSRMEGTVVFDNVVSQIKASSSSDGHLLLMTGLLPPDKIAYSITLGSRNRYPSLADVLPHHNKYLLLADEGVCWNEGNTLRNFGLGEPLAIKDRPEYDIDVYGRDGAMFLKAIDMIEDGDVKIPFMMTLMTISMHIPFKEAGWPLPSDLSSSEELGLNERDYANMCRNTDRYIGEFLKALPENTLVFIASDHHQGIASDDAEQRAFFMAVNTGRTERISRTVGQVNLFPAVLDILGQRKGYGGLAPSAFNPCVDGTVDSYGKVYGNPSRATLDTLERAYGISDKIIRGDYFREASSRATGR